MARVLRFLVLVLAGAWLLVVALRSPDRDYVPLTPEAAAAHRPAPTELSQTVPDGFVVRAFAVEGMCCDGCTGKLFDVITAIPEVREAAVSFDTGTARAVVPVSFDSGRLETALTMDKYSARRID